MTLNTRREESKLSVWVIVAAVAMGETRRKEMEQINDRVRGIRPASDDSRVNLGIVVGELTTSCRH